MINFSSDEFVTKFFEWSNIDPNWLTHVADRDFKCGCTLDNDFYCGLWRAKLELDMANERLKEAQATYNKFICSE